jgi:hypothetical protein
MLEPLCTIVVQSPPADEHVLFQKKLLGGS